VPHLHHPESGELDSRGPLAPSVTRCRTHTASGRLAISSATVSGSGEVAVGFGHLGGRPPPRAGTFQPGSPVQTLAVELTSKQYQAPRSTVSHRLAQVVVIAVVGVGRHPAVRQVELTERPLDARRLEAAIAHPAAGAICTFTGVVRDNSRGERVSHLEYEAYAGMAEAQIGRAPTPTPLSSSTTAVAA
jgi:MoaE protein